jgi:hypothetical protein
MVVDGTVDSSFTALSMVVQALSMVVYGTADSRLSTVDWSFRHCRWSFMALSIRRLRHGRLWR